MNLISGSPTFGVCMTAVSVVLWCWNGNCYLLSVVCHKFFCRPSTDIARSLTDVQSNSIAFGIIWGNDSFAVIKGLDSSIIQTFARKICLFQLSQERLAQRLWI